MSKPSRAIALKWLRENKARILRLRYDEVIADNAEYAAVQDILSEIEDLYDAMADTLTQKIVVKRKVKGKTVEHECLVPYEKPSLNNWYTRSNSPHGKAYGILLQEEMKHRQVALNKAEHWYEDIVMHISLAGIDDNIANQLTKLMEAK